MADPTHLTLYQTPSAALRAAQADVAAASLSLAAARAAAAAAGPALVARAASLAARDADLRAAMARSARMLEDVAAKRARAAAWAAASVEAAAAAGVRVRQVEAEAAAARVRAAAARAAADADLPWLALLEAAAVDVAGVVGPDLMGVLPALAAAPAPAAGWGGAGELAAAVEGLLLARRAAAGERGAIGVAGMPQQRQAGGGRASPGGEAGGRG